MIPIVTEQDEINSLKFRLNKELKVFSPQKTFSSKWIFLIQLYRLSEKDFLEVCLNNKNNLNLLETTDILRNLNWYCYEHDLSESRKERFPETYEAAKQVFPIELEEINMLLTMFGQETIEEETKNDDAFKQRSGILQKSKRSKV